MQSTSSMTSGLLTLSVHEALTLDGVEIALHPDLFSGTSGGIQGRHSRDTSLSSLIGMQGRHTRDVNYSSAGGVLGRTGHVRDSSHPFNSAMLPPSPPIGPITPHSASSLPAHNLNDTSTNIAPLTPHNHGSQNPACGISALNSDVSYGDKFPNQSRSTLQAGDLIELRVWDASPNRSSPSKKNQTAGKSKENPTDYINTNLNHSSLPEEGKTVVMVPSREIQQPSQPNYHSLSEQRRQPERQFISKKPPIVPRSNSTSSSIGASPKIMTGHPSMCPSPLINGNIITPSPVLTSLPPSKQAPPTFLNPRSNLVPSSNNKQHIHEISSSPSSDPTPPSLSSSLSEEGSVEKKLDLVMNFPEPLPTTNTFTSEANVVSSDNTPQIMRVATKGPIKSDSIPNIRMSSLDSSCSNIFAAAVQNLDEYQPPSQKVPDMLDIISKTHNLRLMIVMVVTEKSLTALKNTSRIQVSLLRQVADLYDLSSYDTKISVTKVDKSEEAVTLDSVQADFVTVTIKDHFVSRGEMYQFSDFFLGSWIYAGERVVTDDGVRGNVMEIRSKINGRLVKSGHVTNDTKITFRSCSARIIWLVQISSEMWDYAPPYFFGRSQGGSTTNGDRGCEIYFDRFVSFMYRLFEEWKELEVTHSLTVVFFSRTLISSKKKAHIDVTPKHEHACHESTIQEDTEGRLYEDHFRVVVEDEEKQTGDWDSLVSKIKKTFVSYPSEVGWDLSPDSYKAPSTAAQGNILEAINTALNNLQLHYMDRDLRRSGNSIVVVSAGSGVFEVDKWLAGITKQRMMDNGIGSDMLSLGLPPLHVAPFFLYKEISNPPSKKMHEFDGWKTFFEIPHWMHLSFISYDRIGSTAGASVEKKANDCSMKVETQHLSPQIHVAANSFLIRNQPFQNNLDLTHQAQQPRSNANKQPRHLISGRDFEDILEACRPRNRTESSIRGVPSALLHRLKLIDQVKVKDGKTSTRRESVKINESHPNRSKFMRTLEEDKCHVREWGSVVFGETNGMTMVPKSIPTISEIGSYGRSPFHKTHNRIVASFNSDRSSPSSGGNLSSHLGSNHLMASPASNGLQIQQSISFDIPLFTYGNSTWPLKTSTSTDSLSTMGNDDLPNSFKTSDIGPPPMTKKMASIESLHNAMINYDNSVFAPPVPKSIRDLHNDKSITALAGRISTEESIGVIVSTHRSTQQSGGGIGAALVQFNSGQPSGQEPSATMKKRSILSGTSPNPWFSTYSRPYSLGFNTEHHKKHEAVDGPRPRSIQLLSPFPTQQKKGATPFVASNRHYSEGVRMNIQKKKVTGISSTRPELSKKSVRSPERERKYKKKGQPLRKNIAVNSSRQKSKSSHSKAWVLNPFRQEDEEEVLAKRTHNSRRWSHVFPKGEVEYKRHAGPNWKSLCQPAVLPVTIDVRTNPKELEDQNKYKLIHYEVIADLTYYKSHSDLLKDMVKQRLIQDFQLVPQCTTLQKKRREIDHSEISVQHSVTHKPDSISGARSMRMQNSHLPHRSSHVIEHTLSMGHRTQILTYNPTSDAVKVVQYNAIASSKDKAYRYSYMLWSSTSRTYALMSQNFNRNLDDYPWNKIDSLICGEREGLPENSKYRRISYRIIPDNFEDSAGEEEFIKKIRRLLEFIDKQVKQPSGIQIISSTNRQSDSNMNQKGTKHKSLGITTSFRVPLDKGKRDKCEWMEIVMEKAFDTKRTFRIMFHWLVASAIKVEAQVQLFARRCILYGLRLVQFPQLSLSSSILLHPFIRPEIIRIQDEIQAGMVETALLNTFEFADDGKHLMDPNHCDVAIGLKPTTVDLGRKVAMVAIQQYVHQSGTIFTRLLQDNSGSTFFAFMENRKHTGANPELTEVARDTFYNVSQYIQNLQDQKVNE